jgi:hypothetical protein
MVGGELPNLVGNAWAILVGSTPSEELLTILLGLVRHLPDGDLAGEGPGAEPSAPWPAHGARGRLTAGRTTTPQRLRLVIHR